MKLLTSTRLQWLHGGKKEVIEKSRPVVKPASGYLHQQVYIDDRIVDETLSTEDRDVVLVAEGYHLVGAPDGCTIYHLEVMAGAFREWRSTKVLRMNGF
jgi:5-deoxy-D-glucuronate isomerase